MPTALDQTIAEVEPPSETAMDAARSRLAGRSGLGALEALAIQLAGARHVALPPVARKRVVVACADHGAAETPDGAARAAAIAGGGATVNVLARAAGAEVTVVDCGVRDPDSLPPGVVPLAIGRGTADVRREPAMPREAAVEALDTGVALVLSLAGRGLDVLALGQAGAGANAAVEAVVAALRAGCADPVDVLARRGGYDLGVLAGGLLAAAALRIPTVLDGAVVPAAAALAVALAPAARAYVVAGHAGATAADADALAAAALAPLVDLGITAGEGAGAAVALPAVDAAARLLREPPSRRRLPIALD
ncbi:MAG: hypothetical protein D6689_12145 [Deltaproteobacteria bacterium]|nr:MAG: hypothetical protein D6689_12145 [Deltaproteobacteria bacterium]